MFIVLLSFAIRTTDRIYTVMHWVLVLSNEPLYKNSSSLNNRFIELYENESIYKVEKSKVKINSWSQDEFDELDEIKNLIR